MVMVVVVVIVEGVNFDFWQGNRQDFFLLIQAGVVVPRSINSAHEKIVQGGADR